MKKRLFCFILFTIIIYLTGLPTETVSIPDTNQVVNIPEPVPPPPAVRKAFELDPFYQQWIDVEGFPVVASSKVNPYALKEAAWLIWQMIGHRRDVQDALVKNRVRFSIIAHTELISEIPEYSFVTPDFLNLGRGIGGTGLEVPGDPAVSSSEENILNYSGVGGSYNILIHEFAHAIHLFGLNTIDPTFNNRLQAAYDAAMAQGLWQGTYASSDRREYWAEGTQGWFHPKGGGSFSNFGTTRSALKTYDKGLAALLSEIYGDTEWRYTPPAVRLDLPHLQGFNPQDSPTFRGFPELEELRREFSDPNSDGGDDWVDLRPYDPSLIPILNKSRNPGRLTGIGFINVTQADVLLYGVRYNGTTEYWTRVPPGFLRVTMGTTNEIYLVKDQNGRDLAVFQLVEQMGRAIISSEMVLVTPGLSKVSGDNQAGVSGAALPKPFVVEVRDENLSVLEGISVTFTVIVGDGTLSVMHTTTDQNGQAESQFTLGASLGTNTVEVSAAGVGQSVVFNAVAEAAVNIPDSNLRAVIEGALSKVTGDPITASEMATLPRLEANEAGISNLTGLEYATNLTELHLWRNSVSDISPLAGLTNLTGLYLGGSSASDLSPLVELTNLESLFLDSNGIADLSPLAGLTKLTRLALNNNSVSDLSPLAGLTSLRWMRLAGNNISNLSPLVANTGLGSGDEVDVRGNPLSYLSIMAHIPALQRRGVTVEFDNRTPTTPLKISGDNQQGAPNTILDQPFAVEVRDQNARAFAGVPVVFTVTEGGGTLSITSTMTDANGRAQSTLTLGNDPGTNTVEVSVEGISQTEVFSAEATLPPPIPTALKSVSGDNQSGLTGEALTQPFIVDVHDQYADPMEGVTVTFAVSTGGGSLSDTSVDSDTDGLAQSTLTLGNDPGANIVEVSVEGIAETVTFHAIAELLEFNLARPSGISLIHVPLKVRTVNGVTGTIESVGDLYDALGGANTVNFLITYDSHAQEWRSFFVPSDKGTAADAPLTDDTGIIAGLRTPISVQLSGDPLGTDGRSTITLNQGLNVVGLPLNDSRIMRVSDLFDLEGIGGNVPVIILTDGGEFKLVGRTGDPGDIEITGGQAFIMAASRAATVDISGDAWANGSGTAAAPPLSLKGIKVGNTTPVLGLRGAILDEGTGLQVPNFRVTVKNLSTSRAVTTVTAADEVGYRSTVVDIETGRAATVGDVLEISAQSSNPFIGVEPLEYTVMTEDVRQSWIQLPALVAYEIPSETQLLRNYPNPFNPETWIPYRLAEDAFVTLTIYDLSGHVARTLEIGHRIASPYENRSKAIYWDGRNDVGKQVASGVYFYTLTAGDYTATRKMLIVK